MRSYYYNLFFCQSAINRLICQVMRNLRIILEKDSKGNSFAKVALFTNAILPLTFAMCTSQNNDLAKGLRL